MGHQIASCHIASAGGSWSKAPPDPASRKLLWLGVPPANVGSQSRGHMVHSCSWKPRSAERAHSCRGSLESYTPAVPQRPWAPICCCFHLRGHTGFKASGASLWLRTAADRNSKSHRHFVALNSGLPRLGAAIGWLAFTAWRTHGSPGAPITLVTHSISSLIKKTSHNVVTHFGLFLVLSCH